MNTPYDERMQAVRERLRVALDPQTGPEKSILTWLLRWDRATLEPLADMIERATYVARAEGRDHVTREVAKILLTQPDGIDNEQLALLRSWAGES